MSDFIKWFKPDKVGIDPLSTIIWSVLIIGLWAVALIQISGASVTFSSEVLLFLSAGIGVYFAKKTSTDSVKEADLKSDTEIRTTWGIKPRLARTLLVISLALIYGFILVNQILDSDPLQVTFFISDEKFGTISTLFWAVIGVYAPNFYSLVKGEKE
ncbi:MAG: hypothetical protein ACW991_03130 [Candidatus Hodarchaeales archaeon]